MRYLISAYRRFLLILIKVDFIANFLFNLRLWSLGRSKKDILILATITKTGTHYIRFLIAYYIKMLDLKSRGKDYKISNDDFIVDEYFSNSWHTSYTFITPLKSSTKKLELVGLKDFPRSHMPFRKRSWKNIKVLHTYRDLREQAYVSYKMKYECDKYLKSQYNNHDQLYHDCFKENNEQYQTFLAQRKYRSNSLRISFSQIYHHPEKTLALILHWLGQEPDIELCRLAADLCKSTPSILVGGGEKWHRSKQPHIDYAKLDEFIENYRNSGALGISDAE